MDGEDNIENPSPTMEGEEIDMNGDSPGENESPGGGFEDGMDGNEAGSQEEGTEGEGEEGVEAGSQEGDGAGPNG